jgi:heme oxygenase (biliverdin-producing, ferredoxin)
MMAASFSAELRRATWGEHRRAESTAFLDALLAGRLSLSGYAAMVAQHHHIYTALEQIAAAMRADPVAGGFADPRLDRLPALEADLAYLLGEGWRALIPPTAATERYVAHLRAACAGWPGGFVAHHYTRYLGDMSGGQYIAAELVRIYRPPAGHGVRFYDFSAVGDLTAAKIRYRDLLDAAPWGAVERRRIVEEAVHAYRFNSEVLDDLACDLHLHRADPA